MLAAPMEPKQTPNLSLAGAGSVLIGWIFGSVAWGFLVGAILGLPFGVFMTYKRYGHAL